MLLFCDFCNSSLTFFQLKQKSLFVPRSGKAHPFFTSPFLRILHPLLTGNFLTLVEANGAGTAKGIYGFTSLIS